MLVAVCIYSLAAGGAEKAAINLVDAFNYYGHQAYLVILNQAGTYQLDDKSYYLVINPKKRLLFPLWRRQRLALMAHKKLKFIEKTLGKPFDLVLSNLHHCNQVMRLCGINRLWYVLHSPLSQELMQAKNTQQHYFKKYKNYDQQNIIAVCNAVAQDVQRLPDVMPKRLAVIYNTFDEQKIQALAMQPIADIPTALYVIFIGRFSQEKRFELMFNAFAQVHKAYHLVVLSNVIAPVEALAKKLGVHDRVILPGFQQNPYPWIKQAKLLVCCSSYEGFPNVFIEALSLNTPIVTTTYGTGVPEALQGYAEHWVVDEATPAALAEKINAVLAAETVLMPAPILTKVQPKLIVQQYESLMEQHSTFIGSRT